LSPGEHEAQAGDAALGLGELGQIDGFHVEAEAAQPVGGTRVTTVYRERSCGLAFLPAILLLC
jgi:hypothetical protein